MKKFFSDIESEDTYFQATELDDSFFEWLREKGSSLNRLDWERIYTLEFHVAEDFDYSEFILTKKFITTLREMTIRMYNNICAVKSHAYNLFSYISLLFGLCSSQSSIIFSAFFGTSLSRIPTL